MRDDITGAEILDRLKEAAQTLRRLPPVRGPMGHRSHWPEWLRDAWFKYGSDAAHDDQHRKMRIPADGDAIDRMDEAIPWLQLLPPDEAKLVWAKANKATWFMLARRMGVSERTARRRFMEMLLTMAQQLNQGRAA